MVSEREVVTDTLWVIQGILASTGVPYNHCILSSPLHKLSIALTVLTMILLCSFRFNREFTLLFIINMTETELYHQSVQSTQPSPTPTIANHANLPTSLLLNADKDRILTKKEDISTEVRLPLFSLSRGKSAFKLHSILRLLVQFHFPALSTHLQSIHPNWWKPYSYSIEKQDDFVTVGRIPISLWIEYNSNA